MVSITPSPYQDKIYDFVKSGSGSCIVEAVAGSGKTTTIVDAFKLLPPSAEAIFSAFNKHIADELKGRLPGRAVSTMHSYGWNALRSYSGARDVDQYKISNLIKKLSNDFSSDSEDQAFIAGARSDISRLISLGKANCAFSREEFDLMLPGLLEDYDIDFRGGDESLIKAIASAVFEQSLFPTSQTFDFDDMIYEPVRLGLPLLQYDFVFIDETQDLSPIQHKLAEKMLSPTGRMIAVGDRRQGIYGFRGASLNSMDELKSFFSASELPLSICYRCSKAVVKEAQLLVPQIETFSAAPEGEVLTINYDELLSWLEPEDYILCRVNAPLVRTCLQLIRENRKAYVLGREIGKSLTRWIENICPNLDCLVEAGFDLLRKDVKRLEASERISPGKLALAEDKLATVLAIIEGSNAKKMRDVVRKIEDIFQQSGTGIRLSTIHKAKGLEANRVFLLRPDLLPHPRAASAGALQQEANLEYVAITRAKQTFCRVME